MKQQFCSECGGKLIANSGSVITVCGSCGEKYQIEKKWWKTGKHGKQKKKNLYTVIPLTSNLAWKPIKTETIARLSREERERDEKKTRVISQDKLKSEKKKIISDDRNNAEFW
ncbi:MAG: hypothetical protein ACXAEU_23250 [Candidatus Hodarchaeales archaeon]